MPLEQAAIDAAQRAFGITLSGDSARDNDTIQQALAGATGAQKAVFVGVRYGGGTDAGARAFVDQTFNLHSPITNVITGPGRTVSVDDPSVAWAKSYWDGINAARAEVAAGFDDLLATGFSGRPTFDPNNPASFGVSSQDRSYMPGGTYDPSTDNPVTDTPRTGFRNLRPKDRTLADYGGSIPSNTPISVPPTVSTGSGNGGGGGSGNGTGGGGDGGSNGSNTDTDDTNTADSAIQRLIDFAAGQYASGGGGGAGVVGLPSEVAVSSGDTGTSKVATLFVLGGGALLVWWLWKKYKGKGS